MAITKQKTDLTLDFQAPNRAVVAHAKQNDKLSRYLVCQLVDGGNPWTPPANIMSAIRFKKPDGHGGFYDLDEQNNAAVAFSGSIVTLTLAEQVLTVPGTVYMELNVYTAQSEKLTTFCWTLEVEKSVLTDTEFESTDYFNILTQQIADILGRVQSVAGLTAEAEGVPWGSGTSVAVTGGSGPQDPFNLQFEIEQAKAQITKDGYEVTISMGDADGETSETFIEPQAKVTKQDDVLTISLTDVDGTTEETLLAAAIRLASFYVDTTTGQLVAEVPSDYDEMSWSINNSGDLVAEYEGEGPTPTPSSKNYENLINKPQINGVTLSENKTSEDLGLASQADLAAETERAKAEENRLLKMMEGIIYEVETDTDKAYSKTIKTGVPAEYNKATVQSIGGKSVVMNQLLSLNSGSSTASGVTVTYNSDGTITINGTATANGNINLSSRNYNGGLIANHKYTYGLEWGTSNYRLNIGGLSPSNSSPIFQYTYEGEANLYYRLSFTNGDVFENEKILPRLIDLTQMFGTGNEPSTVADAYALGVPREYVQYSTGEIVSAEVQNVVSRDINSQTLDTLSIPAEVKALEGYGWSAGTAYNEVDFANKKFIKRVGRVDMGTLSWMANGTTSDGSMQFIADIAEKAIGVLNFLTARFSISNTLTDGTLCGRTNDSKVIAHTKSTTSAAVFKSDLNGVMLYYELATPVETDISAYLTDDDIIVESGGTVTYEQQAGGLDLPVPNSISYIRKLSEE